MPDTGRAVSPVWIDVSKENQGFVFFGDSGGITKASFSRNHLLPLFLVSPLSPLSPSQYLQGFTVETLGDFGDTEKRK